MALNPLALNQSEVKMDVVQQQLINSNQQSFKLNQLLLSPKIQQFFTDHGFELDRGIDEYQELKDYPGNFLTPLLLVIAIRAKIVVREDGETLDEEDLKENAEKRVMKELLLDLAKELLDNGADINLPAQYRRNPNLGSINLFSQCSPLMLTIFLRDNSLFRLLVNYWRSINFNYFTEEFNDTFFWGISDNDDVDYSFPGGDCLMAAMSVYFSGFYFTRDSYAPFFYWLQKKPGIDFLSARGKHTLFSLLSSFFTEVACVPVNFKDQLINYFSFLQRLVEGGAGLNHLVDGMPPINAAFDCKNLFNHRLNQNVDNPLGMNLNLEGMNFNLDNPNPPLNLNQDDFVKLLKILFAQIEEIRLNVHSNYAYDDEPNEIFHHGTPLMVAISLRTLNVNSTKMVNEICTEIQFQALQRIRQKIKLGFVGSSARESDQLKDEMTHFVHGHSYLKPGPDCATMRISNAELHQQTIEVLDEAVLPFVLSMIPGEIPKQSLGEMVFSQEIKQKLVTAGFDLQKGLSQSVMVQHPQNGAQQISLLSFAAQHGLKALILCIVMQPTFTKEYTEKEVLESFCHAVSANQPACVDMLISLLPDSNYKEAVKKGIGIAYDCEYQGLVRYFLETKLFNLIADSYLQPMLTAKFNLAYVKTGIDLSGKNSGNESKEACDNNSGNKSNETSSEMVYALDTAHLHKKLTHFISPYFENALASDSIVNILCNIYQHSFSIVRATRAFKEVPCLVKRFGPGNVVIPQWKDGGKRPELPFDLIVKILEFATPYTGLILEEDRIWFNVKVDISRLQSIIIQLATQNAFQFYQNAIKRKEAAQLSPKAAFQALTCSIAESGEKDPSKQSKNLYDCTFADNLFKDDSEPLDPEQEPKEMELQPDSALSASKIKSQSLVVPQTGNHSTMLSQRSTYSQTSVYSQGSAYSQTSALSQTSAQALGFSQVGNQLLHPFTATAPNGSSVPNSGNLSSTGPAPTGTPTLTPPPQNAPPLPHSGQKRKEPSESESATDKSGIALPPQKRPK